MMMKMIEVDWVTVSVTLCVSGEEGIVSFGSSVC